MNNDFSTHFILEEYGFELKIKKNKNNSNILFEKKCICDLMI